MSVSIASAEIELVPAPKPVVAIAPAPVLGNSPNGFSESLLWQGADLQGTAESYQGYLDAFPQGQFVNLARIKLDRLKAAAGAQSPAPVAPTAPATYIATASPSVDRFPGPAANATQPKPASPAPAPPTVAVVGPAGQVLTNPDQMTPKPVANVPVPAPAPQNPQVVTPPTVPAYTPSPVSVPAPQAPPPAYTAPTSRPILTSPPAPTPAPVTFMTVLHNPRDSKPLPAFPPAPRLTRDGYPTCRESYQSLVGPIEKANAIKSCIEELNRFSTVVFNGFAQAMIQHQKDISKLYSDYVGAQSAYTPESQNWFYSAMMQEHANSNPGGANYAEFSATKQTYDQDRAYLQDRFCFYTGSCGGYAPPPGVAQTIGTASGTASAASNR